MTTTYSSRQFNQDTGNAKKAARCGPVFITDRGKPSHVLLSIDDFQKLAGNQASIVELLKMPNGDRIEFDPPRMREKLHRRIKLG